MLTDHEVRDELRSEPAPGDHPASVPTGEVLTEDERILLQEPLERSLVDRGVQVGLESSNETERERLLQDAILAERAAVQQRDRRASRSQ